MLLSDRLCDNLGVFDPERQKTRFLTHSPPISRRCCRDHEKIFDENTALIHAHITEQSASQSVALPSSNNVEHKIESFVQ